MSTSSSGSAQPARARALVSEWSRDGLRALPFVLGLLVAAREEARAYTDPGTGALLWQMIAAGFVGAMFYVRKFTSWFKRDSNRRPSSDSPAENLPGEAKEGD